MNENELLEEIKLNVVQGRINESDEGFDDGFSGKPGVTELVIQAIEQGISAEDILLKSLTRGMEIVGQRYEEEEYFLPDMLASAEAVGDAMDILEPNLVKEDAGSTRGKIIMATVEGDIHDIGKNIVSTMFKGAGYSVFDMGVNVKTQEIINAIKEKGAGYIGLSALLTTTMKAMEDVVKSLQDEGLKDNVKVLIGGPATSPGFTREIGADVHCADAFAAIKAMKQFTRP